MQKTTIGISVGLFGAGLFFMGIANIIPLVLMAGYVLIFEENEWLKKTAIKAVAVVLFFSILTSLVGLIGNSATLLSNFLGFFNTSAIWLTSRLNNISSFLITALNMARILLLVFMGIAAFKQGSVAFAPADNAVKNHM